MNNRKEFLNFALIPLASIVAGFLVAFALSALVFQPSNADNQRQAMSNLATDSIANQITLGLESIKQQHASIASSTDVVEIASSTSVAAKLAQETTLAKLIPHAIKVQIFAPGMAKVDRDAIPPFNFTSLDLVNNAETNGPIHFEALNSGGKWLLMLASPIKLPNDDRVRGTLFVYLDMKAIAANLQIDGHLTILQKAGTGAAAKILTLGTDTGATVIERELSNKNWFLEYSPATSTLSSASGGLLGGLIPAIVFLAIALVGIIYGINKILKTLHRDLSHLDHQVASVASGLYEPSDDYQIDIIKDIDLGLGRLGKKQSSRGPVEKLNVTAVDAPPSMDEMVGIEMLDDDEFNAAIDNPEDNSDSDEDLQQYATLFKAYDIRGIVNETLTPEIIHYIGLAIGSAAAELGQDSILVASDGRVSSPGISQELINGILASGRDVINIGAVPTPLLYFATNNSDTESGVMITGSHNPADHNGFKIVLDGHTLVEDDIQALYQRILAKNFTSGEGELAEIDISEDYIDAITDDVVIAQPLKVVVDCANGIASELAPELLSNLGCEVTPLYCEVDGTFPNHSPDPTRPENLQDLALMVKSQKADLGLALDGDGDRLVAVTKDGDIVWPDRLLMLFTKDVVSRNPGSDVVYDVKCSRHLNGVISGFGGRPVLCRSGHSYVKQKMKETDAILGGEMSGHICFSERWFGFDDGLYTAARLLEIVGAQPESLDELLAEFPESLTTPEILVPVSDSDKFEIINQLIDKGDFGDGAPTTVDGIRVDYADGWGLIRASNTNATLTLRFEADDEEAMGRIKTVFKSQLQLVDNSLDFE